MKLLISDQKMIKKGKKENGEVLDSSVFKKITHYSFSVHLIQITALPLSPPYDALMVTFCHFYVLSIKSSFLKVFLYLCLIQTLSNTEKKPEFTNFQQCRQKLNIWTSVSWSQMMWQRGCVELHQTTQLHLIQLLNYFFQKFLNKIWEKLCGKCA